MLRRTLAASLVMLSLGLGVSDSASGADDDIVVEPDYQGADARVRWTPPSAPDTAPPVDRGGKTPVSTSPDGAECARPGSRIDIGCGLGGEDNEPPSVGPVVEPVQLAEQAVAQLVIPRPPGAQLRPYLKFADGPAGGIVGMPSWLWIPPAGWRSPETVRVSAGPVWAEVTAEPVSQTWIFGDGGGVTCRTSGTEYKPGMDPMDGSPDCGYRFTRSSKDQPGGKFTVRVVVHWRITWVGSGNTAGELPLFPVNQAFPYVVREARAQLVAP